MVAEAGIEPALRGLWDLQGHRPFPPQRLDDNVSGGPGGNRTLISWVQATDPPVERRAHPGEDNGTRTRTPALTTRRLSLRLCPPQDGPSGGRVVGSRGFEPRSARSERAASANCATSRLNWSEWRDSNPHLKAWKACRRPLPHTRFGSAYGNRTRPSALATRDAPCTPRPNVDRYRSPAHRRPSVVKDPALASVPPVLATAPGFEPGPASVGDSDASVTPRCRRHDFTVFEDRTSLCPRARVSRARSPIKKAF